MRRAGIWAAGTGLIMAAAGCGKGDPPAQPEPRAAAAPSAAPSAAPATAIEASAAPAARPTGEEAPLRAKAFGVGFPVHVFEGDLAKTHVGESDRHRIFAAGDQMVVAPGLRVLKDGELQPAPTLETWEIPGSAPSGEVYTNEYGGTYGITVFWVMGRFPDEIWMSAESFFGYIVPRQYGTGDIARYTYQRQYGKFGRVKEAPLAAWPWSKRRTLAYLGAKQGFTLAQMPKKGKPVELPAQAKGEGCAARVNGLSMVARTTGEVLVLGSDCDRGGRLSVERWDGDTPEALASSKVIPLPSPEGLPKSVWLWAAKDVAYAVASYEGKAFAAEIRGGEARAIELPFQKVEESHLSADGTLFLVGDGVLHRAERVGDGVALAPASLPRGASVKETAGLFAVSRDEVYLAVVLKENGSVMLSSRQRQAEPAQAAAAPAAASADPSAAVAQPIAGASAAVSPADLMAGFPELSAGCATPMVVLFAVARSVPKDFDYAEVKAALRDHPDRDRLKLVEIEHKGERFLGVAVKDEAGAKAVVDHWKRKKPDGAPRAACFEAPAGAREIKLD